MKTFKDNSDAITELHKQVGVVFPVTINVEHGKIILFEYETEWVTQESEDAPLKNHKLTSEQVDSINEWVKTGKITKKK